MAETAFLLIQYSLAFVFIRTGVLIFRDMPSWADSLQKSWVKKFLPATPERMMQATAVFDIAIGVWLIVGIPLWVPALLAALHLLQVLIVTGIMSSSYRDVGLLGMAVALFITNFPWG